MVPKKRWRTHVSARVGEKVADKTGWGFQLCLGAWVWRCSALLSGSGSGGAEVLQRPGRWGRGKEKSSWFESEGRRWTVASSKLKFKERLIYRSK